MILKLISTHEKVDAKTKEIVIENHGVTYRIQSHFLGIEITNDHDKGIIMYATDDHGTIIIR